MSEFDLIAILRDQLGSIGRDRLQLGIGDDAALWLPRAGHEVVVCCDTLISGRHFPSDATPHDIAYKALAVNLSDLAAMAAEPVAALLALTLPARPDRDWLDDFCIGWASLAEPLGIALAGGDTTRGPALSLTVTCLGELPTGTAMRRDGARDGDGLYVSGSLGDAALALSLWSRRQQAGLAPIMARLNRPQPRLSLGCALRGLATSAIDVSDGLVADLRHILNASGVGARIELQRLPLSPAALAASDVATLREFALSGGDDYELCFTVPVEREPDLCAIAAATATRITRIGQIHAAPGLHVLDGNGNTLPIATRGWDHFHD